jgi:hypothetical protein
MLKFKCEILIDVGFIGLVIKHAISPFQKFGSLWEGRRTNANL